MKLSNLTIFTILAVSPTIQAQTDTGSENQEVDTSVSVSTFADLSPGNQMIARSLMDAQVLTDSNTDQIWTLDQIVAAGSAAGWGRVFRQMRYEGVIMEKNLGQVVSAYAQANHRLAPRIDEINGEIIPETPDSPEMQSDASIEATDTETVTGAFDKLSPGNQKVARALMDAQILPADDSTQIWTLDQIAVAKSETGWGEVFHRMQSEGLITAKNLGQVISQYQQKTSSGLIDHTGSASVTANELDRHGKEKERGKYSTGRQEPDVRNMSVFSVHGQSGQDAGSSRPIGDRLNLPVSASHGITTATGANISINNRASIAGSRSSTSVNGMAVKSGVTSTLNNSVKTLPYVIQSDLKHGNAFGHGK